MIPELKTLQIGQPAQRALEAARIETLLQLCSYSKKELLALHGIGPKALRILNEIMLKEGLTFKE